MKYYDYVVSLGASCYTAIILRKFNLQGASNVFDWSGGNIFEKCGIGGFSGKINLICEHFDKAFNFDDLEIFDMQDTSDIQRPVRNKRTGLQYIHDFPNNKSIEEEFDNYLQKYQRRVARLYQEIEKANSVLFLFLLQGSVLPISEMQKAEQKINKMFNNKIDFLIIQSLENTILQEISLNKHLNLVLFPNIFIGDSLFNPEFEKYLQNQFITKYKIDYLQNQIEELNNYTSNLEGKLSDEDLVMLSGFFDQDWYAKEYLLQETNLLQHYLTKGYLLQMNPSLKFDGNKYLEENSDVNNAKLNPLLHYLRYGKKEGRKVYKVIRSV